MINVCSPDSVPGTAPIVYTCIQQFGDVPQGLDWLSPLESAALGALRVEKRRQDWLLGRWTAKLLVMRVLAEQTELQLDPTKIFIEKAPDGAPVAHVPASSTRSTPITISLSHSHGVAAAALVAEAEWPLGIDLELCEPRHPSFADDYFTPAEQQQLAALAANERLIAANAIWSGKEAALKALRFGLTQDTRAFECRFAFDAADRSRWAPFAITRNTRRLPDAPDLTGHWRLLDGFVLTVASHNGLASETRPPLEA